MLTSSLKERLIQGGTWAISGKALSVITGLILNILLARLLSPSELGAYFLTFNLLIIASSMAQLGSNQTVLRLIPEAIGTEREGRARKTIWIALQFTAFGTLVMVIFLSSGIGKWLAQSVFKSPPMVATVGLAILWISMRSFQVVIAEIFRGFHDIRMATIFGGMAPNILCCVVIAYVWIIHGKSNLREILIITVASTAVLMSTSGFLIIQKTNELQKYDSSIKYKEVISLTLPLYLSNLTYLVLTRADLWILGIFRSPSEVAIYGAVVKLIDIVAMPLLIANAVIPPIISEMYAQGKKLKLEKILRTTATLAGIPAFVGLIIFLIFGSELLAAIFGEFYSDGYRILVILSIGQLIHVTSGSCGYLLNLTGFHKTAMKIVLGTSFLSILFSLILVKNYGGLGIAIAFTSGLSLLNLIAIVFAIKKTGIKPHLTLSPKAIMNFGN